MQNNQPQKTSVSEILKSAFFYWNKTLFYQLIFSLLYFFLFFLGYFYLFRYFGLWDHISPYSDLMRTDFPAFSKKMEEIAKLPQTQNFVLGVFFLFALLNPLNVGLYQLYRKIDLKEKIEMNDLFVGYLGYNFFKFLGFYLFWIIVFTYANAFFFLGIAWVLVTLFSVPLMFFMNVKTFEGISLTVKALRGNSLTVVICMMVAGVFSFSGILLFGFGFLLTFPFWNAVIYALYKKIYNEIG